MSKKQIKITPIGGVGQIGSNCTLIQYEDINILIDCGILFPYDDSFDINYLIPDLDSINIEIDTIVITHGHEDHIGAIRHYVEAFPEASIYAPRFAKKLMDEKLNYLKIPKKIQLLESLSFGKNGDLVIDNIHVNHSIPDTRGLIISSKALDTAILFISDFKIDKSGVYEDAFDFETVKKFASSYKRRIALLDSTNILSGNKRTPSESSLIEDIKEACRKTTGTTYITTFASNIHRVQTIINIGKELNRAVIPYGRSMIRYSQDAIDVGILDDKGVLKDAEDKSIKRQKIVITSGSQGEFRGTTRRVVSKQDPRFKLKEGDTYIFSSKAIPGNEKKLAMLFNDIVEQGCNLITAGEAKVHASGHPGKEDLKEVYEAFKPTHAFPIHGESLFLKKHVEFILDNKLSENAEMILNGAVITINENEIEAIQGEINEPILIHGNALEIQREKISERRKLATQGAVIVSINKDSINKYKINMEVTTSGLPLKIDHEIKEFKSVINYLLKELKNKPLDQKQEKVRVATRRYFGERLGYRPVAIVHIC